MNTLNREGIKMKRKILIYLCILFTVCLASVSVSAASANQELYLNRLMALEILPDGMEDEAVVTRGQMAAVIFSMNGTTAQYDKQIFSDVPPEHEYFYGINGAYSNGLISGHGDGKFMPDEPVTKEQMIKMLMVLAGYEQKAQEYGGYPGGYMSVAVQNGIVLSNGAGDGTVSGEELIYSAYKTLEMPIVERTGSFKEYTINSEKTLLKNLMRQKDLEFKKGIMTFDGVTDLYEDILPDQNIIKIDTVRYVNKTQDVSGLIGRTVEFWYSEDEIKAIYTYKDENSEVTYQSKDIASATLDSYKIEKDDKKDTIRLSPKTSFIYNMQALGGVGESDLIPKNGTLTFVDNNNDRIMDVVIITEKQYYVVEQSSRGGYAVQYRQYAGQSETGYFIDESKLSDTIFYFVTNDKGEKVEPEQISRDSVVGVSKSKNGSIVSVVVTKKVVDGVVNEISLDGSNPYITVEGVSYTIGKDAKGKLFRLDVSAGDSAEFFLNEYDDIVYCGEVGDNGKLYAYVVNVWKSVDGDTWKVKVVTSGSMGTVENKNYWWVKDKLVQNNEMLTYTFDPKARLDGIAIKDSNPASYVNNVVHIELNPEGNVRKMEKLTPEFEYTEGKYNHNTQAMYQTKLEVPGYDNPAVVLAGNVKTLVIPADTVKTYTQTEYMAKYRIENGDAAHQVMFYDIPENSQTPRLLVLKATLSEAGTAQGEAEKGIVSKDISYAIDEDGEPVYKLSIYNTNGSEVEVTIREDAKPADGSAKSSILEIKKGDLVELTKGKKNQVIEVNVIVTPGNITDGRIFGKIQKIQTNVIWNKSNADELYHVFYYINENGDRVEDAIKAAYPIFRYNAGGTVEIVDVGSVMSDESLTLSDSVIIMGGMAVIIPHE